MKTGRIVTLIVVLLVLAVGAGIVILARTPMKPPVQTVQQVIPDAQIPH